MRREEADLLLAALLAAYPWPEVPEATRTLYRNELRQLGSADIAREAVQLTIRNGRRWPSLAELLATYREALRRRQEEAARERGLEEEAEPRSPEHARLILKRIEGESGPFAAQLREVLGRMAAGGSEA
jgi:hypothetical protein